MCPAVEHVSASCMFCVEQKLCDTVSMQIAIYRLVYQLQAQSHSSAIFSAQASHKLRFQITQDTLLLLFCSTCHM